MSAERTAPIDEAQLTAYAFGELSDAEAGEVEAWLDADPQRYDELAAIHETADILAEALRRPAAPRRFARPARWLLLAAAAALLLAIVAFAASGEPEPIVQHKLWNLDTPPLSPPEAVALEPGE